MKLAQYIVRIFIIFPPKKKKNWVKFRWEEIFFFDEEEIFFFFFLWIKWEKIFDLIKETGRQLHRK